MSLVLNLNVFILEKLTSFNKNFSEQEIHSVELGVCPM